MGSSDRRAWTRWTVSILSVALVVSLAVAFPGNWRSADASSSVQGTGPATNTPTPTTPSGGGGGPVVVPPTATPPQNSVSRPGPPVNGSASAADSAAVLTWDPPFNDGGSAITAYRILNLNTGQSTVYQSTQTERVITSLTNGTEYSFQVNALNVAGAGEGLVIGPVVPLADVREGMRVPVSQVTRGLLQDEITAAFGPGVITNSTPLLITSDGGIKLRISVLGLEADSDIDSAFSIDSSDMVLTTSLVGAGTADIGLRDNLRLRGAVQLAPFANELVINFSSPELVFTPDVVGDPVTDVQFIADVNSVPANGQIDAERRDGLESPLADGTLVSGGAVYVIGSSDENTAIALDIEPEGFDANAFGDVTVSITVNTLWIANITADGLLVGIVKFDGAEAFLRLPQCSGSGGTATCRATFDGAAGGFSEFGLVALKLDSVLPTPTPSPTPAPQETATAAPSATSTVTVTSSPTPTSLPQPTATVASGSETPSPTPAAAPTGTPPTGTQTPASSDPAAAQTATALARLLDDSSPVNVGDGPGSGSGSGWASVVGIAVVAGLGVIAASGLVTFFRRRLVEN